jgi:RNA polymerase sigma-70 factor (ECF subfamily)
LLHDRCKAILKKQRSLAVGSRPRKSQGESLQAKEYQLSPPETWVDTYADYLYSYALYRVSNQALAEDLVQEAFVAALAARSSYQGKSSEKTWLTAILKNKILDYYRKRYREKTEPSDDLESLAVDQFFDEQNHPVFKPQRWLENPEKQVENREFMTILESCLETVSPKQSDAFRLREINQVETEEICKILQITTTNYWVLMHRARIIIRRCLEIHWFGREEETT